jgi:hypothetical protein
MITFQNSLTQTEYDKVIKKWKDIASKSKSELTDIFWRSLDDKAVNKDIWLSKDEDEKKRSL